MSEILKVLNRKSVELKSEKVELGIVQDLEAKVKDMIPTYNELEKTSEQRQDIGIEYSKLKDKEKKLVSIKINKLYFLYIIPPVYFIFQQFPSNYNQQT